jgi:hypothetical protein
VLALSACQKQDATPPTAAAAPAAPVTPPYTPPTADQLSQMVAPIALFPDKLVAQVLAGATYPTRSSRPTSGWARTAPSRAISCRPPKTSNRT